MVYDDFGMYGGMDGFSGVTETAGNYSNAGESFALVLVSFYLLLLGAILIGAIVDYLLRGFGMYKMGKAEGRNNCWLAFVPFARTYFQGELSGEIKFKERSLKNPGLWLVLIPIIAGVVTIVGYFIFMIVMVVGTIASDGYASESAAAGMMSGFFVVLIIVIIIAVLYQALISVLYVLVNHQIYGKYTSKNMAIVHAVLGTLVPLYEPICMFIMGRRAEQENEAKMYGQSGHQEPVYQEPVYQNAIPRKVEDIQVENPIETKSEELPKEMSAEQPEYTQPEEKKE